ncbi:MAG TPA: class I SAM-dependent methyltransferase [Desulfonatronum sp.]|nr:class I SAM-dependent methyltransferase [Desulfonatronum sp.]
MQMMVVNVHQRQWKVHRPGNLEELWEKLGKDDFGPDERIPYWVDLWPSSNALVEWLELNQGQLKGAVCLDVGCGLGLSACVASSRGARVIGLDYMAEALRFAGINARANAVASPLWVQMDWRFPAIKAQSFDLIWGADIFYESRFAKPLIALFNRALAPGGRIWLAEPKRSVSSLAWDMLRAHGWTLRPAMRQAVQTEGYYVDITIWEAEKKE